MNIGIRYAVLLSGLILAVSLSANTLARPAATQQLYLPIISHTMTKTEVTLWYAWDFTEQAGLQAVISAFEAANPTIDIKTQYMLFNNLRSNFETAVTTGNAPELLIGPADWGPALFSATKTQDLAGQLPSGLLDTLQSAARGGVDYNGHILGLPHTVKGVLLFRNRNIIPTESTTYSQFKGNALAAQIVSGGTIQQYGAYLERGPFFSMAHLTAMGGSLLNSSDGRPAFNTTTGQHWLNLLKDFQTFGGTSFNDENDVNLFVSGLVGYIIDGSWNINRLSDSTTGIGSSLAIDRWPSNDSGVGSGNLSGYVQTENIYLSSSTNPAKKAAAIAFMSYLLDPTAQQTLLTQSGHLPAVQGVTITNPLLRKAATVLGTGVPFPLRPEIQHYWGPMEANLPQVFNGAKTAAQALNDMSVAINTAIDTAP